MSCYKMDRFCHFLEMARSINQFKLPDSVMEFLKNFIIEDKDKTPENRTEWGQHINIPATLNLVKKGLIDLFNKDTLTAPPKDINKVVHSSVQTADGVTPIRHPVKASLAFVPELAKELGKQTDISQFKMGRTDMANTVAKQVVGIWLGRNMDNPKQQPVWPVLNLQKPKDEERGNQYTQLGPWILTRKNKDGVRTGEWYVTYALGVDAKPTGIKVDPKGEPLIKGQKGSPEYEETKAQAMKIFDQLKAKHDKQNAPTVGGDDDEGGYGEWTAEQLRQFNQLLDSQKDQNLVFDDDDKKYLKYFEIGEPLHSVEVDSNGNPIPGTENEEDEISPTEFIRKALIWRYSPILIDKWKRSGGSGRTMDLVFKRRGKYWLAKNVPVNAEQLSQKLTKLYHDYGLPFLSKSGGAPVGPIMRWLKRTGRKGYSSTIRAGKVRSYKVLHGQRKEASWRDKFNPNLADEYRREQAKYLKGEGAAPVDFEADLQDFNPDVSWDEVIAQEARVAASQAISRMMGMKQDSGPMKNLITAERDAKRDKSLSDISSAIFQYLLGVAPENSKYRSQRWRIRQGVRIGMDEVKRLTDPTRRSAVERERDTRDAAAAAEKRQKGNIVDIDAMDKPSVDPDSIDYTPTYDDPSQKDLHKEQLRTLFKLWIDKQGVSLKPGVDLDTIIAAYEKRVAANQESKGRDLSAGEKSKIASNMLGDTRFVTTGRADPVSADEEEDVPMKKAAHKPVSGVTSVKSPRPPITPPEPPKSQPAPPPPKQQSLFQTWVAEKEAGDKEKKSRKPKKRPGEQSGQGTLF